MHGPLLPLSQVTIAPTTSTAVAVSCAVGAKGFLISVATNDVNVTFDGTTATGSNGHRFIAGAASQMFVPIATNLSVIGNGGTSAVSILWVR